MKDFEFGAVTRHGDTRMAETIDTHIFQPIDMLAR
jgi:hypothetical protein